MKTYHGERTEEGCEVTVNGEPLQLRSDLSGNASSAFDWGFVGTGQLSMAILSDFLGDDPKAKSMCDAFEKKVVAELPHRVWTLTSQELTDAVASLVGAGGMIAPRDNNVACAAYGDMPVATLTLAPPSSVLRNASEDRAQLLKEKITSAEKRAEALKPCDVTQAAGEMAHAAEQVAVAAAVVGKAAHQVAHVHDRPADEPMSTANRDADRKADDTNCAVDAAAALRTSGSVMEHSRLKACIMLIK